MLTVRDLNLIRVALVLRLDTIQLPALYQEHKDLLAKLWQIRAGARLTPDESSQPPIST